MLEQIKRRLDLFRIHQTVTLRLARGAASAAARTLDRTNPNTWEFSAFSQNGEDGVLDYLTRQLLNPSFEFLEIGSGNESQNGSGWLSIGRNYSGTMVLADADQAKRCRQLMDLYSKSVQVLAREVLPSNAAVTLSDAGNHQPDVFILDVDGLDYYVADMLWKSGFGPKIVCVEYNSSFGPDDSVTVPMETDFNQKKVKRHALYYGVSINGWQKFFSKYDYRFLGVDQKGTKAFFVLADAFHSAALTEMANINHFRDNHDRLLEFRGGWKAQRALFSELPVVEIR